MASDQTIAPRARSRNLVVREVEGELIIFDRTSNVAHHLTAEVAATWKHCDGETTISQLADAASATLGRKVFDEEIWRHLVQLGDLNLLEEAASRRPVRDESAPVLSRRSMLMKAGVATAVGVGLPLITSVPIASASCAQHPCNCDDDCVRYGCPSCNPANANCDNGGNGRPCTSSVRPLSSTNSSVWRPPTTGGH